MCFISIAVFPPLVLYRVMSVLMLRCGHTRQAEETLRDVIVGFMTFSGEGRDKERCVNLKE